MTFAISAVRKRLHLAEALASELPDARVYVDDPPSGSSWNNYPRALLEADGDWLVKIDDDAILCQDFARHAANALATCPGDFAEFYFGPGALDRMSIEGASWLSTISIVYGIAWAIRGSRARDAAAFGDGVDARGGERLRQWLRATGRRSYITIPNLVDHRRDQKSVLWGRPPIPGNHSPLFAADPSSVVWTDRTVSDGFRSPQQTPRT
jgi:hypothetical protein